MTENPPPDDLQAAAVTAADLIGRRVGPYQLETELGRGGMGSVWLARRDDGHYEGKVAIKLLVTSWFGKDGAARFRHEGMLLARLDHPNIARLLDAGVSDLGEPYLVLEYVEGQRMDEHCASARLDLRARIELFLELLGAVAHAHRNLIVHRDIKPANVLVTAAGKPKLLDFGIGKLVHDQEALLTRTGHRILTPQYAAPEQLLGEPVTTATDIYALGLLLYVLLTGRLPHAGSPAELIRRITLGGVPPPSSIAATRVRLGMEYYAAQIPPELIKTLRRELRGDLDNIVLKALHAAPAHRYCDVGAFAADLRRFLNHEPVSARPATMKYRVGKFVRRNRTGVAATILVLLAIVIGTAATVLQALEARRQRADAEYQARSVQLITDFLNLSLFSEGGPDRPVLTMQERIQRGAKLVESQYGNDPSFAGRMLIQMADRLSVSAATAPPLELLDRAYALGLQAGDADLMAAAECNLIPKLVLSGLAGEFALRVREAQRLLAGVKRPQLETRATCLVAQAKVEQAQSNRDAAAMLLLQAAAIIEREQATFRPIYSNVLSTLTGVYIDQRKLAAAIGVSQQAARLEEQFGRADTSEYLSTRQNVATLLLLVGEVGQSLADREQINQLMRKFSPDDEMPLVYGINQVILLARLARAAEAQALLPALTERARAGGNLAMVLQFLHMQAWLSIDTGDLGRATSAVAEAQRLLDQGVGSNGLRSQMEMRRSQIAIGRQDVAAARKHMERALALSGYGSERAERSLARVLMSAAQLAVTTGDAAEAERFASEALRMSEEVARGADTSADVGESLLLLAKSRSKAPLAEQRAVLERAIRCLSNGLRADHPLTLEARMLLQGLEVRQ